MFLFHCPTDAPVVDLISPRSDIDLSCDPGPYRNQPTLTKTKTFQNQPKPKLTKTYQNQNLPKTKTYQNQKLPKLTKTKTYFEFVRRGLPPPTTNSGPGAPRFPAHVDQSHSANLLSFTCPAIPPITSTGQGQRLMQAVNTKSPPWFPKRINNTGDIPVPSSWSQPRTKLTAKTNNVRFVFRHLRT